tara:strand:- start:1098 stop:1988 length:891 start_codon:yes stop_codon:yes gene_type:complete
MNEVVTINTESYASMAKAMGLPVSGGERKINVLNRLKMQNKPILGEENVLVKAGSIMLEKVGDVNVHYFSTKAKFRPFLQRFMYKRYFPDINKYSNTIMADNLNIDLKDDFGTFNCGKPAGFVKDFQALPESVKTTIKEVKRHRVVFGTLELEKPVKLIDGKEVQEELPAFPVLWEIKATSIYKDVGDIFSKFSRMERLPLQHEIVLDGSEVYFTSATGEKYYKPTLKVDYTNKLEISEEDHKTFGDFLDWVKAHNDNILRKWDDSVAQKQDEVSEDEIKTVEQFIDVELEDDSKS